MPNIKTIIIVQVQKRQNFLRILRDTDKHKSKTATANIYIQKVFTVTAIIIFIIFKGWKMEKEKTIKLNRIDILNVKGCLLAELHDQQNQLEQWQQQKDTTPEYIYNTNIYTINNRIIQLKETLNKLN